MLQQTLHVLICLQDCQVELLLQGALVHCNVHIQDLHRLENVVTNALQKWIHQRSPGPSK